MENPGSVAVEQPQPRLSLCEIEEFHRGQLGITSATTVQAALQALVRAAVALTYAGSGEFASVRDGMATLHGNGALAGQNVRVVGERDRVATGGQGVLELSRDLIVRTHTVGALRLHAGDAPFDSRAEAIVDMLLEHSALIIERINRFEQLQHAKREWEQIFDGMVDGVYICRADGVIARINRAVAGMLSLRIADILGHKREELHELLPDYQVIRPWNPVESSPAHLDMQTTEFRCGTPERVFIEVSFLLHANNGHGESAGASAAASASLPVGDTVEDEGAPHRVCILRDVTEQRRLQEQLLQSEKLAALGELVTGVAHELNNPLTTVVGYAQLLQGDAGLPPNVERQLHKIHQEAVRASHIVQNLLAFARRSEPHKTWIAINTELESLLKMRDYQLQADNVRVVENHEAELPHIWGDPHQLQQVFLNIINNAAQAMVEWRGGGEIAITTESIAMQLEETVPGVRITFADNGPGIAPDHLRKVFDPFFTTKSVGLGTGLGMSISLGIVSNHNGRIWAESRLGHGARFILELPIVSEDSHEAHYEAPVRAEFPSSGDSHVLVIDDEEPVVTLITEILSLDGHRITPAFNGAEALALLQVEEFDLIVSDVRMPAVGGPTFFEILQTTRPDLLARVIFVTGDTVSTSTQQFLQKAGRPMLAKPFDPERLRALVNETLAKSAADRV